MKNNFQRPTPSTYTKHIGSFCRCWCLPFREFLARRLPSLFVFYLRFFVRTTVYFLKLCGWSRQTRPPSDESSVKLMLIAGCVPNHIPGCELTEPTEMDDGKKLGVFKWEARRVVDRQERKRERERHTYLGTHAHRHTHSVGQIRRRR